MKPRNPHTLSVAVRECIAFQTARAFGGKRASRRHLNRAEERAIANGWTLDDIAQAQRFALEHEATP